MAINTSTDRRVGLTIKYATDYYTPPLAERDKLFHSLVLAQQAVRAATERLAALAARPEVSYAAVSAGDVYRTLRRHFRLTAFELERRDGVKVKDPVWQEWRADLLAIVNNYKAIRTGLMRPLAIADAHSTLVGREVRRGRQAGLETAARVDERRAAQGQELLSVPEIEHLLLTGMSEGYELGVQKSAGTRGMVSLKKAVMEKMTPEEIERHARNDLTVHLTAAQQTSIHINFLLLLHDAAVTRASVARTIIHEASHKFCCTRDFAYAGRAGYHAMTKAQALLNADSYAFAAVCLYKRHYFPDDTAMQMPPPGMDLNA